MKDTPEGSITSTYEETYQGYEISIGPNRDPYREGFEWSVCKDGEEIDGGLAFSIADSLEEAHKIADKAAKSGESV
jgi:hypothetical protein